MAATVRCHFCNEEIDPNAVGVYRRVVGWTRVREQGGTNSITLASEPTGWACRTCIDLAKLKGEGFQNEQTLF